MSTELVVFRSDHASVLDWISEGTELQQQWQDAVAALRAEYPERSVYTRSHGLGRKVVGLGGSESPGEGWRRQSRGDRLWVADKRSKAGKAVAARLESLTLSIPPIPGMPDMVVEGNRWCHPGVNRYGDTVWVSWSCSSEAVRDGGWSKTQLDESVWSQGRLSEFFAAKEATESVVPNERMET